MKTVVINFSGRFADGNGEKLCAFVQNTLGLKTQVMKVASMNIHSCNKCDYECLKSENACRYSSDDLFSMYDSILDSDLAVFIIPVYSEYPCSNYFVFRERSQGYFNDVNYQQYLNINKKFIILANNGYENTVNIIRSDFRDLDESCFLNLCSNHYNTKSVYGNLLEYEDVRKKIEDFIRPVGK